MSSLSQLGRYRIEAYKGSRGEADVYRAFDMIRKRTVLLLTIKPETAANPQKLNRILHNAQAVSELVHPRLGWVWETGAEDGVTYVAERFINGPSLRERLDEGDPLDWEEASQALEQLAQGLDFLHSHGRVHGALRPENITLSPDVGAVLSGLGVPEAPLTLADLEAPADTEINSSSQASAEFDNGGTPAGQPAPEAGLTPGRYAAARYAAAPYTAPEVWMGEAPSPAADQYALACVLVEMLSGKPLFGGADASEICERSLEGPTLPAIWPEGTPWQIEPALERALAQQPAERFASAGDFAAAPARLAARTLNSESERRQREAQRQARLEVEAQARRQAEEAERLAALERARREVEEQARQAAVAQESAAQAAAVSAAAVAAAVATAPPETTPDGKAKESQPGEGRRRPQPHVATGSAALPATERPRSAVRWARWPIVAGALLLLALAWLWDSGRLPGSGLTATSTTGPVVTQPALAPTSSVTTAAPTTAFSETPEPSLTFTPRPTATATRRPTRTPTITATATVTPTETRRPTPTRTPRLLSPND